MVDEHNSWIPRDFWLEEWEKQAIVSFYAVHALDGYGGKAKPIARGLPVAHRPRKTYTVAAYTVAAMLPPNRAETRLASIQEQQRQSNSKGTKP